MAARSSFVGARLPVRPACAARRPRTVMRVKAMQLLSQRPDGPDDDIRDTIKNIALITAIKTPYLPDGKMDLRTYDRLLEAQIQNGVEGVIVGGTTGEGQLMSWDEHIMLIAHTVNKFGNRVVVVGNTGSNSTREALHATEQGFAVGMHAALSINPYYGKTSKKGVLAHLNACMDIGPTIVYNVASRTGQDVTPDIVMKLAEHHNFLGMKECAGNRRIEGYVKEGILCWSGNDDECHDAVHEIGARGVISVTSNIVPGLFSKLMKERDADLNASLQPLIKWLFHEPNPIPVNTAMMMLGLCNPVFRTPYVPCDRSKREEGARLLEPLLAHIPLNKGVQVMEDEDFQCLTWY